jgi:hypothetical protein
MFGIYPLRRFCGGNLSQGEHSAKIDVWLCTLFFKEQRSFEEPAAI